MPSKRLKTELILASVAILLISCGNDRNRLTSTTYETKTEAREACSKWTTNDGSIILFPDVSEEMNIEGTTWTSLDDLIERGDYKNTKNHSLGIAMVNQRTGLMEIGTAVQGFCKEEDGQYLGYRRTAGITKAYEVGDDGAPTTYLDVIENRKRIGRLTDTEGNTTAWILKRGTDKLSKRFRYK